MIDGERGEEPSVAIFRNNPSGGIHIEYIE
jgi:hypothetical protein